MVPILDHHDNKLTIVLYEVYSDLKLPIEKSAKNLQFRDSMIKKIGIKKLDGRSLSLLIEKYQYHSHQIIRSVFLENFGQKLKGEHLKTFNI